jgi:hypothetical protein
VEELELDYVQISNTGAVCIHSNVLLYPWVGGSNDKSVPQRERGSTAVPGQFVTLTSYSIAASTNTILVTFTALVTLLLVAAEESIQAHETN